MGPRPPLAPKMNPPFLTFGRTMTQSAFAITSDGMFWSLSIFHSTLVAFFRVSSSLSLLPAHAGKTNAVINIDASKTHAHLFLAHAPVIWTADGDITSSFRNWNELHSMQTMGRAVHSSQKTAALRPYLACTGRTRQPTQ